METKILAALSGRYNVHVADLCSTLGVSEQVLRFSMRTLVRRHMIRETTFPAYSTFSLTSGGIAAAQSGL